jgi:hypothetical protein
MKHLRGLLTCDARAATPFFARHPCRLFLIP